MTRLTQQETLRTYEQICLDKLKKIGISTSAEWCAAMGYKNDNGLAKVIRRINSNMPYKLKVHYDKRPRRYEAL
ncbi:hypothetical protein LCGC14_2292280 [marine sediment metagenome]|uniref:Uncharacterized protein n=1 Tax=marine sediment metagenome TaxID=412755 RepID=A0A0F9FL61_9ZZZZ